jgi:hypothetical protein
MSVAVALTLAAGTFFAALASGLAGFAFAMIASGVFLLVLPPLEAVPVILAASFVAQFFTLPRFVPLISWPRLAPFILGGLAGVPLGAELLRRVDIATFRLAVGAFLVTYSLYLLFRSVPRPFAFKGASATAADGAVGFVGGVMGGMAGLSGAIPTPWCGLRGWNKDEQRAVYQPYILVMQLAALLWLGASGSITRASLVAFAVILLPFLAGIALGLRLYARVNDAQFRRIVLGLLLVSGLILVATALR